MNKILSRVFNVLKYLLLILSFGVTLFGILKTYQRLEKSLLDSIDIFLPFVILLILYIVNLFVKNNIKDNLLYNFVSCLVFITTIIIGLRAGFDQNMLLYKKYGINYNPAFLSDNLASIRIMIYSLSIANAFLLISNVIDKPKKIKKAKENL